MALRLADAHRPLKVALVVLGLSPTGLYVVREAAATGVDVYGYSDQHECGASSRYVVNGGAATVLPNERLLERLAALSEQYDQIGVIPTTDRHVEYLSAHHYELPANLSMAQAYRDGVAGLALDKTQAASCARAAGLYVPTEQPLGAAAARPADVGYPLILKPKSIHEQRHWLKGRKLYLCTNDTDWAAVVGQEHFIADEWTAQALIDGPESNIYVAAVFADTGGVKRCFTARKLRQYPVNFGSASLLVSHPDSEVEAAAKALIEQAGFQGIAGIEFKRDVRDGHLYFIEMNPRPSLWFRAATATGHYLVYEQLKAWFGASVKEPELKIGSEVAWRYAVKDRLARRHHARQGGLLPSPDTHSADALPDCWAVYDSSDFKPAIAELAVYARKAFRR